MIDSRSALRCAAGVRIIAAFCLLTQPDRWTSTLTGPGPVPPKGAVRVLALRTLCQNGAVFAAPTRRVVGVAAVIDALHSASMLATALLFPDYRRLALRSGLEAGAASCFGMFAAVR